jgi:beta-glucosidase
LYPFGFGLSYATFQYSNLTVTPKIQTQKKDIQVQCDVTNTGKVKGDEVVQLYIKDVVSSVTVYETELRGFERITLLPGEKKTVKFIIHPQDLALLDKSMNWVVEPGQFEVLIGSSSTDIRVRDSFDIR